MQNDFVYWDDMWNEEESSSKKECCGKWNDEGECTCKDMELK